MDTDKYLEELNLKLLREAIEERDRRFRLFIWLLKKGELEEYA